MSRILAIGAHGDDVDLGCAGLLQRGDVRRIVVLSAGGRAGDPAVRRQEAQASAAVLGAELSQHDLPDTALETATVLSVLEAEIRDFRPDLVLTVPGEDTHQDHRAVHDATRVAVRDICGTVLAYCSPSAAERWRPDWFVALTEEQMAVKLQAVACHRSQAARAYTAPAYVSGAGRYWAMVSRSAAPFVEAYAMLRHREG